MKNGHALHVYFGTGKGKTTAAMGLALRAAGHGRKVLIAQMLKTNTSGELKALKALPGVRLALGEPIPKLTAKMTDAERLREAERQRRNFDRALAEIDAYRPELIVYDELLTAQHLGFMDLDTLLAHAQEWLDFAEVALTGRWCDETILERADYATEMVKRRHPYDMGVMARKGIEY